MRDALRHRSTPRRAFRIGRRASHDNPSGMCKPINAPPAMAGPAIPAHTAGCAGRRGRAGRGR
ncbi:DUF1534 domain-containing protein [Pseudomonas syringae UB303]|uniref:DUF1534 domain-containing protein n=1 Tax=Pseudomonas syringae UB303 TaxID=1357287 RepID=A0AAJ4B430_PSESX|nr:DUF1534 domain-containing protein [Pseudomonas syringae UB303]